MYDSVGFGEREPDARELGLLVAFGLGFDFELMIKIDIGAIDRMMVQGRR